MWVLWLCDFRFRQCRFLGFRLCFVHRNTQVEEHLFVYVKQIFSHKADAASVVWPFENTSSSEQHLTTQHRNTWCATWRLPPHALRQSCQAVYYSVVFVTQRSSIVYVDCPALFASKMKTLMIHINPNCQPSGLLIHVFCCLPVDLHAVKIRQQLWHWHFLWTHWDQVPECQRYRVGRQYIW